MNKIYLGYIIIATILISLSGCLKEKSKPQIESDPELVVMVDDFEFVGTEILFVGYIVGNVSVVQYQWDFDGDGIIDWSSNTTGNTSHTYDRSGNFNVSFIVVYNDNIEINHSQEITIESITLLPPSSFIGLESSIHEGDTITDIVNITVFVWIESYDNINSMSYSLIQGNWIPISSFNVTLKGETREYRCNVPLDTSDYPNDIYDIVFSIDLEKWGNHQYEVINISINN